MAEVVARYPGRMVWEPFCGGLNSAAAHSRPVLCSDISESLIALYQAVADGWDPPTSVSRDEFYAAKSLPASDPVHGFCAFGCSFGGMNGTYAVGKRECDDYCGASRRAIIRDVSAIKSAGGSFAILDFCDSVPAPIDAVIYCDPPYAGTTGYGVEFNRDQFIERCRQWARFAPVLVSEYDFPIGRVVAERTRDRPLHKDAESRVTERIYLIEP